MHRLSELIVLSAKRGINLQKRDGSMPSGKNGPRQEIDTPVRNTAHWVITFLKAYEHTGNNDFKIAAIQASDYLLSKDSRPMNAAFWCRMNPEKDPSNGLIGQAWVIEALSLASKGLKNPEYGNVAKDVFKLHPFDRKLGLWRGLSVDGSYRAINLTFNQQLWFAASGALLCQNVGHDAEIASMVEFFVGHYQKYLHLYRNGLICHAIPLLSLQSNSIKKSLLWHSYFKQKYSKICIEYSIGYHTFNLYAFSLLCRTSESTDKILSRAREPKLRRALKYVISRNFCDSLSDNAYAFSYNPVGFEIALVLNVFSDFFKSEVKLSEKTKTWIEKQVKLHFCVKEGLMIKNTLDPNTLAARIYEATRLPDLKIEI